MADTFYQGKNILITGCTGFVGKVLLEKILFSLPQIKKVFVFIRPKKGSLVQERFRKEILDSLIFDRLKQRENDFDSFMLEKVQPIAGDLQQESLALDPTDRSFLIENLDIIISSAASVDFNQRLDQALQINTLGTLRVLDLAKSCKNLVAYVHVSTAYVNCIRKGWVEEKIYPMSQNPQSLLQELLNMTVAEIEQKTPDVLGNFPNTYTFTKSLTENLMQELGKDLPLCILRPTCIGGSWKEPVAGWVDTVSAVGAFNLALGLGIMKVTNGN